MTTQIQTQDIADLAVTNAKIAAGTIDLTTKPTGILPIANGGTGTATGDADGMTTIRASADQTTAGDAQNVNHNDFSFSVLAGKRYMCQWLITISANNITGDSEINLAVSAGTMTGNGQVLAPTTTGVVGNVLIRSSGGTAVTNNVPCGAVANNEIGAVSGWCSFVCDTNATLNFQFGTNAPSGGTRTSTIYKGSWFKWVQVST